MAQESIGLCKLDFLGGGGGLFHDCKSISARDHKLWLIGIKPP